MTPRRTREATENTGNTGNTGNTAHTGSGKPRGTRENTDIAKNGRNEKVEPRAGNERAWRPAVRRFKKAIVQRVLGGELAHHLGRANRRYGTSPKTVLTDDGPLAIEVARDAVVAEVTAWQARSLEAPRAGRLPGRERPTRVRPLENRPPAHEISDTPNIWIF